MKNCLKASMRIGLLAAVGLGLSACGVKGPLERPPRAEANMEASDQTGAAENEQNPGEADAETVPIKNSFFLDFLL